MLLFAMVSLQLTDLARATLVVLLLLLEGTFVHDPLHGVFWSAGDFVLGRLHTCC